MAELLDTVADVAEAEASSATTIDRILLKLQCKFRLILNYWAKHNCSSAFFPP